MTADVGPGAFEKDAAQAAPGWSEAELATLTAIAETFVEDGGGGRRRAILGAEALSLAADPAQVRQLKLVLRLFESRAVTFALAGRFVPFRSLDRPHRERLLLDWGRSRLALRRSAFQAFRKLFLFLAYADPGADGPNPLLIEAGYRPDDPPIPAEVGPIRPLALAPGADPIVLDADVVVVGSGAGGGVVAAELARTGKAVLVIEAGPFVDESTMPRDEMAAYDRLYLNHGLTTTWDGSVTLLAGAVVGGGTVVNWMTCIDAPEAVRSEWATAHGLHGVEGPAWDSDLVAIEMELDVHPATLTPPKDAAILRGAAALGLAASTIGRNAINCADCGSCPFGCRRGTKRSGPRAHLAEAYTAGARIVAETPVVRVTIDGGRATGVVGRTADGRHLVVHAGQVVVAAGALRTPAVLARSGVDHPAIGRHLRLHPAPVVAGLFEEPIEMWRGTMQAARVDEFGAAEAGRNGYLIESAPGHPGLLALALPWEGSASHAGLMRQACHIAPLVAVTRDGGEGRVSLTRAGRVRIDYGLDATGEATMRHAIVSMARLADAAGAREVVAVAMPAVRFAAEPSSLARSRGRRSDPAFQAFLDRLARMDFGPNRGSVFSAHQMGTARMGADPRSHVCDPEGRVRSDNTGARVGGLYVADASLFPTALGVNPMVTVMTLARRVARTILAES